MHDDLFTPLTHSPDKGYKIELPDAEIFHYAALFSGGEATRLYQTLCREVEWRQEHITLYGREHAVPRLTAWYGDAGTTYTYSGIRMQATPWLPVLLEIKARIECIAACSFNSVLINRYRDGADSVAWHADDEPELGRNPVIGSVSFGASRPFQLRHKGDRATRWAIELHHGSFLLMKGPTQHHWLHQIPKTTRKVGERVNLTFRWVS